MGSKGGGGTNTVESSSAPPPDVMAQYDSLIAQANQAAGTPLQQYQGNIVAPFNSTQNQAFNEVQNSQGISQPYYNEAQGLIQNASQPITASPITADTIAQYTNPYTQQVINSTMANINQQDQGQQQSLIGNAASQGAWGGDRSAVAQSLLANQQDLANNQTIAGLESQGYSQALGEANTQQQAQLGAQEASQYLGQQGGFGLMNLGTNAQTSALTGANALTASGGLQQQLSQEQLNVPYEQFQQSQAYPYQNLSWLSGISTGLGSGSGGTSSTTSPAASLGSQLGGLGLTGLGIAGATGSLKRGGSVHHGLVKNYDHTGLIKRLAEGGAIMMPPHYDSGGIIPGQVTVQEMENSNIPDVSQTSRFSIPQLSKGVGIPNGAHASGSSSSTTGSNGSTGSAGADILAAKGLKRLIGGSGSESLASQAGTSFDVANAQNAGLGDMVQGFQNADGTTNVTGAVNAAGDSIEPGVTTDAAAPSFMSSLGSSLGFNGSAAAAAATPDAATVALPSLESAGFVDAATPAVADATATAADAGIFDTIGSSVMEALPFLAAMFNKGGSVHRGLIKHYDDGGPVSGGLTPFDTSSNPMANSQTSKLAQMPIEQLRQLATRLPPTTPQGQQLQKVIQQKQMMPNAGQSPSVPNMPMAGLPVQQQKRGGLIKGYDDGGDVIDNSTPVPTTMPSLDAAPINNFTPTAPINKPDPWLALAATGAGMMASKSPHVLEALGQGAQQGLQNYGEQKKEAAQESYQQGNLQKAAEQLAQEASQHKDALSQQQAALAETSKYHAGELANQQGELGLKRQEAQKPIFDKYGNPWQLNKDGTYKPISLTANAPTGATTGTNTPNTDPVTVAQDILQQEGVPMLPVAPNDPLATKTQQGYQQAGQTAQQMLDILNKQKSLIGQYTSGPRGTANTSWLPSEAGLKYGASELAAGNSDDLAARQEAEKDAAKLAMMQSSMVKGARPGVRMIQFSGTTVPNPGMSDKAQAELADEWTDSLKQQVQRGQVASMYSNLHPKNIDAILNNYEQANPIVMGDGSKNTNWMPYKDWIASGRPDTTQLSPAGKPDGNGITTPKTVGAPKAIGTWNPKTGQIE